MVNARRIEMHYLSIGAIFRMENSWLDEWIHYHHALGVERFYLVCHDRDTHVADRILQPSIRRGLVELQYVRDMTGLDQSPTAWVQLEVYKRIIQHAAGQTRWLAMIDLDEFLLPRLCDDVRKFLEEYEEESAIAVNWQIFGTNGHIKRPPTQVKHLLHRAKTNWDRNCFIKSIVQPDQVICDKIPNVHWFPVKTGNTVNEKHEIVQSMWNEISTVKIRLNHYLLRSWQDFWEVKCQRARSIRAARCDEQYFVFHDRNEVYDDEISKRFGHVINTTR
jgi:hypothetical protein